MREHKILKSVGLKLDLDGNFFERCKIESAAAGIEEYVDIEITYKGETLKLFKDEFINLLGFKHKEPPGTY